MLNTIFGSLSSGVAASTNSYESISTVTVGSAVSSISFTSIPATYTHLQIRCMTLFSVADKAAQITFNSDTGNNYSYHRLFGTGSSVIASSGTSTPYGLVTFGAASSSNTPGSAIIDILDYANTNKYKTVRDLSGTDANGNGYISMQSSLWRNTNAITSITLTVDDLWNQYSSFALYGIKGS